MGRDITTTKVRAGEYRVYGGGALLGSISRDEKGWWHDTIVPARRHNDKKAATAAVAATLPPLRGELKWWCDVCSAFVDEDTRVYECSRCGEIFNRAENDSHICPSCSGFGSVLVEHGCPDCNEEVEEVDVVECSECGEEIRADDLEEHMTDEHPNDESEEES